MAELESVERVIRATALEFGNCLGWTELLNDALKELDEAKAKRKPVARQSAEQQRGVFRTR